MSNETEKPHVMGRIQEPTERDRNRAGYTLLWELRELCGDIERSRACTTMRSEANRGLDIARSLDAALIVDRTWHDGLLRNVIAQLQAVCAHSEAAEIGGDEREAQKRFAVAASRAARKGAHDLLAVMIETWRSDLAPDLLSLDSE